MQAGGVPGGLDDEIPADDNIRKIVNSVQPHLKSKYPREFHHVEPISYRSQVVAGMNYFVKVAVHEQNGAKKFAHMRIYKPFRGEIELTAVQADVEEKSQLKYFQ